MSLTQSKHGIKPLKTSLSMLFVMNLPKGHACIVGYLTFCLLTKCHFTVLSTFKENTFKGKSTLREYFTLEDFLYYENGEILGKFPLNVDTS